MTVDEKGLRAALRPLGRTTEGVRKKLIALGAKGTPEDSQSCSIAVYLAAKFPEETVTVDGEGITVNGATITTPVGARGFIEQFDAGRFPELIKHPKDCDGVKVHEYGYDGYVDYEVVCGCEQLVVPFPDKAEASAYARRARRAF